MKRFLQIIIITIICSCNKSKYYGYVCDFDEKKPINNVIVYDYINKSKAITNSAGYFEIPKNTNGSSGVLIFGKNSYYTDTIRSFSIQNGEFMKENFKGDTIYIFKLNSEFKKTIIGRNQDK